MAWDKRFKHMWTQFITKFSVCSPCFSHDPTPLIEASSLAALQEGQVLFEQRMQDSVSQQLLQLRA